MISKKSRKVVAALLIGATVCASGTFAYFNAKTDLSDIEGLADDAQQTLKITNGKIKIQGKIAGTDATDISSLWGYDVARVSTLKAITASDEENYDVDFANIMNGAYQLTSANGISMKPNYITKNQSPDILGLANDVSKKADVAAKQTDVNNAQAAYNAALAASTDPANDQNVLAAKGTLDDAIEALEEAKNGMRSTDTRATIGEAVSEAIVNARPGDAFALGGAGNPTGDITTAGITIDNQSNLTTKIGIRLNKAKEAEVLKQIESMNANGWKIYIKVVNPLEDPATGLAPYADWTELKDTSFTTAGNNICSVATVKPEEAAPTLQMRVELPLTRKNYYQDRTTGDNVTDPVTAFDIANMFEIVATQENNPGWNEDGSVDNPITVSSTTTP